jgi:hypothetical protein
MRNPANGKMVKMTYGETTYLGKNDIIMIVARSQSTTIDKRRYGNKIYARSFAEINIGYDDLYGRHGNVKI